MGFRKKRIARPGSRELYTRLAKARKALEDAERRVPWFAIGDVSDGPEIGALLDEAMIELWHAKQAVIGDLGRTPQEGEQTELDLESGLCAVAHQGPCPSVAPCGGCGHATIDHAEGLRCIQCGCTSYTTGSQDELRQAVRIALEGHASSVLLRMNADLLATVLMTSWEPWSVPGREHLHQVLIEALESDADRVRAIVHEILGEGE